MSSLSDVEFTVLATNASVQAYTVQLQEAIQNFSFVVASAASSVGAAPASPAVASSATTSTSYMASLSYNFTFNACEYLLLELPTSTVCCS